MRILILTQKVDRSDPVLGFFHRWIEEFSKHSERVTVIALGVGEYDLPTKVKVFSLGKERGLSRLAYVVNFYRIIWRERKNYDGVFVHMNPIYVILGGLLWKFWGKKTGLWYTHKNVDTKLRIAEKLSDIIFTASRESFRLKSNKVKVVGHGIDTDKFHPAVKKQKSEFHILTAGRISPVKDYETFIGVTEMLSLENIAIRVDVIGSPATPDDVAYLSRLQGLVKERKLSDTINFIGAIPNNSLPSLIAQADVFINLSQTGSLDKAVLEAMSCGVPVVTSNESLSAVLGLDAARLVFSQKDVKDCVSRLREIRGLSSENYAALSDRLRLIVEKEHNIKILIPRILAIYETNK